MKQTKHILRPLLMAIVMLVGMLVPQGAWAAEDVTIDGITFSYDVEGDGITISYCESGEAIYVEVPEEINGTPVTKIGGNAFNGKNNLRVVVLPASITTLGESIFRGTDNLLAIEFKGEYPPADINESAFYAFNKSNLFIVVPEGRVEAYQEALGERLAPGKFVTKMPDLPIFLDDIEYRITDADSKYVSLYSAHEVRGDITIPATISDDKGVEYTVTEVAGSAFDSNRDLTSVTIPGTVETIGDRAFLGCSNLATVTLSEGVHALGTHAFCNTALTSLVLPASLTSVGVDAFSECNNLGYMVFMGNKPKLHTQGFLYNRTATITLYVKDLSQWNTTDKLGAKDECEVTYKSLSDYCSDVHGGHTFASKTLTAEPDANGLYAYACDRGCGAHSDDHIVKGDSDGNIFALTATTDGETTTYTAANVTLEDGKAFASPVDFTVTNLEFKREFSTEKGMYTVMVPFGMSVDQAAGFGTFYTVSGFDTETETVTLAKVSGGTAAHTAYIFKPKSTESSHTFDQALVKATVGASLPDFATLTSASATGLYGTYQSIPAPEGSYGYSAGDGSNAETSGAINAGSFVKVGKGVTLPAYRAVLWVTGVSGASASPARLNVDLGDMENGLGHVGIDAEPLGLCFDLNGRPVSEPRRGEVFIMNGRKFVIK